ncbi:hypothetical protein BAUCODRAFT_455504 [Baudoinia panamericana UAMH 10762]|uniref:Uncharacterized protein n=1 Tax=Baudoinia panamericana (strain UAMH 10762) TaxID=717646 RepID=M2LSS9_BAUPA|nr:uncharacterized protein BAUCODRAFT_455504 [Baudoinia panamericana UAMH 10762]EMC97537.1 hypothetical protein BAUCODRAFT_455504 [Baudoinia panamericana UAMH 10762]
MISAMLPRHILQAQHSTIASIGSSKGDALFGTSSAQHPSPDVRLLKPSRVVSVSVRTAPSQRASPCRAAQGSIRSLRRVNGCGTVCHHSYRARRNPRIAALCKSCCDSPWARVAIVMVIGTVYAHAMTTR